MTQEAFPDLEAPDGSKCLAVGRAAEEIGAALAAGREPDIEGLIARNPEIEEEIRSLLPALLVLGKAERPGEVRDGGAGRPPATWGAEAPPEIGDFRIVREIGRGGMGVVYEALQVSLGRRVALKVLPFAAVLDPRQVQRFRNEAQAAAQLHHTHIVPVFAVGCERGVHYYAMQYIDGQSLAELIAELRRRSRPEARGAGTEGAPSLDPQTGSESSRPLTPAAEAISSERSSRSSAFWRSVARLGAQAADALDHAHELGIVHRDIKPSNLLLDARGNLWVTDFGLAHAQGDAGLTLSGDILGTLRYMSPEQALGKRGAVDARSDIYSLGATLYEIVTLAPALPGKERKEILERIAFAEPAAPRRLAPSIPRDLETIVLKALAKEPEARYTTAREMAADLARFIEDRPIRAKRPGPLRRALKWVRRHRAFSAAAATIVISLGVVGALLIRDRLEAMRKEYDRLVLRAVEAIALFESRESATGSEAARRLDERSMVLGDDPFIPGSGARARVDSALQDLGAAEGIFPRRPDAPYHRARTLALLRKEREAMDEVSRLLRRSPDFVPGRILRAALEERSGDSAAARADLDLAREGRGGSWAGSWFRARQAAAARRWDEAAQAYTELIRSVEEEPYAGFLFETRLGRGLAFFEAKDHLAALRDFAAACDRWPRALAPALLLGQTYLAMGEEAAAERWFEGLHAASDLKDEVVLEVAGIFNRMESEGKGGEKALAWVERMAPSVARERARMKILADLWRYEEAARVGEETLARDPGDAITMAMLASIYTEVPGQATRSRDLLQSALRLGDGNATVHFLASNVLSDLEDPPGSLAQGERAVALAPESQRSRYMLAWCYLRLGKYEPARRLALELLERDPSDFGGHWILGILARFFGNREAAIEHLEAAIRLKPRHMNGANVWLGCLYADFGEYEEAERTYRNSLQAFPGDLSCRWMLAVVLQARGKHDEALREYCEALPRFPNPGFFVGQWALSDSLRWRPLASDVGPLDDFVETYGKRFAGIDLPAGALQAYGLALLRAPAKRDAAKALALLESSAGKSKGEDPRILASLADARFEAGMRVEAVRALERALRLPGACGRHQEQLEDFRRRMLPAIVTLASVDASVGTGDLDPAKVRTLLDGCRRTEEGGPEREVEMYLEGLTLEADGRLEEAIPAFARLAAAAPWATEPALREAECLRRLGRPAEAEAVLRQAIEAGPEDPWPLWEVWWRVAVGDLRKPPADLLAALPGVSPASVERADFRWLLERLAAGEPLRIDSGATADRTCPGGKAWSRDRFVRGGTVPEGGKVAMQLLWPHDGPIAATEEEPVYRTERWFLPPELCRGYRIPLPEGSYRVTLHFAEVWWRTRSAGGFDVRLEGREVLGDFQPVDAGFATAQALPFQVDVADGFLDLELVWDGPNLPWWLAPPKISGIEVERLR